MNVFNECPPVKDSQELHKIVERQTGKSNFVISDTFEEHEVYAQPVFVISKNLLARGSCFLPTELSNILIMESKAAVIQFEHPWEQSNEAKVVRRKSSHAFVRKIEISSLAILALPNSKLSIGNY